MRYPTPVLAKLAGTAVAVVVVLAALVVPARTTVNQAVDYVRKVGITGARICTCRPDVEDSVTTSRGLQISISIYRSSAPVARGRIILVHGNTPIGRNHPLYRVLGTKLSQRGFRVVAPDLAGFGDSENPFAISRDPGYRFSNDLQAVIDYLATDVEDPMDNGGRLVIVGHSMGAVPALRVGLSDVGVAGVVAVGPPRLVRERMESKRDRSYFWNRAKRTQVRVYGTPFPDWFSKEDWRSTKLREAMEHFLPALQEPDHVPVLFVDGGREQKKVLEYLERYVSKLNPPVSHNRIAGSDHYANVKRKSIGGFVLYDAIAVKKTVDAIDNWFDAMVSP